MTTTAFLTRIPGPRGHFLLGSAPDMRRDRLQFLLDLARDYGDIARIRFGPMTLIQVNHPDGVQRVLQENNHNYSKRLKILEPLKWTIGNGLLTNDGESWLRQRRLMQPAFHRQHIASFGELMVRETLDMLRRWERIPAGQPLDVAVEMMRLTLVIVTQALFSTRISDESGDLYEAITFLLEDYPFRFDRPFYPSPRIPTAHNRRYLAARARLDEEIYRLIEQRRRSPGGTSDLLDLLMNARDEETGKGMTDQQLRDELLTLFLAGHETTANALTWTFYLLSQHPQEQQELRSEIERVLGERPPAVSDLPSLHYTRMVIEEAMRLYPPVWVTNRMAEGEDEICGYRIPAGSIMSISPYATQRMPEFWPDPDRFDPQRFAPEQAHDRPRYAYFPFGGGPRMCIGSGFAMTEAQLILASVVQRCRLALIPGQRVEAEPLITLRPRGGLKMYVVGD